MKIGIKSYGSGYDPMGECYKYIYIRWSTHTLCFYLKRDYYNDGRNNKKYTFELIKNVSYK